MMHPPNPILDEIRLIRDAIAKASDHDLTKIAEAARSRQKDSGREIVQLAPKRVDPKRKAS